MQPGSYRRSAAERNRQPNEQRLAAHIRNVLTSDSWLFRLWQGFATACGVRGGIVDIDRSLAGHLLDRGCLAVEVVHALRERHVAERASQYGTRRYAEEIVADALRQRRGQAA